MVKKKLVHGKGLNDADYVTQKFLTSYENGKKKNKLIWSCPFYVKWRSMLERCYCIKFQQRGGNGRYAECDVCDDWLRFSTFKSWMQQQDWEGKQLDKDILVPHNKLYSPSTCAFVDKRVNLFVNDRAAYRGTLLIGVSICPMSGRFKSACSGRDGGLQYLGLFDTELEAHKAWLAFKLEQAKILAAEQSDPRVAKALIERYENYVVEECDKS